MAGQPAKRKKYEEQEEKIARLAAENERLRSLMAAHCPELLEGDIPPPPSEYSPDIAKRITAMGRQGMDESEWIAALGLSVDTWDEWIRRHPELARSAETAHGAMIGYWSGEQRRAISENNTRFPVNIAREKIGSSLRQSQGSKGDASKLVVLDCTSSRCPHCAKDLNG